MEAKDNSSIRNDALLEEYKSLREEILKRQNARLNILGFTIAAIGTIIGFVSKEKDIIGLEFDNYIFALSFALIILIAALILTIQYTQAIDIISAYIRKYIESKVTEIGWETRWTHYRNMNKNNPKSVGLPLGTSKPLAYFYALLTISIYCIAFISNAKNYTIPFIIVSVLTLYSLFCSLDLDIRITKGWKINWDLIDKYLFGWEEIPGNDSLRLTHYLKSNYGVGWVEAANIAKIDNGKIITITDGKNCISLNLNNENTELILKIDNVKTDKLIVRNENGKLNIYIL